MHIYIYNISYFPTTKSFRFLPENRIIINKYIYIYISNNILFILLFTFFLKIILHTPQAPGVKTEFWYFASNDFCGDLKNWTGMLLSNDDVPLVTSVSYGWQGDLKQIGCKEDDVTDVDNDFAKLAAKGITIIFASGDSGSGYAPPRPTCSPSTGTKGTAYEGEVASKFPGVQDAFQCCFASGANAWTFIEGPKPTEKYCDPGKYEQDKVSLSNWRE